MSVNAPFAASGRDRPPASVGWALSDRKLALSEPLAVGIVNVSTDSMFSGARSATPGQALRDGRALLDAGFEMLDVGAVAARSGPPVPADRESALLLPALAGLAREGAPLSADTFSAEVAAQALDAGAAAINDIGGGAPEMLSLAADRGCGLILMHIEGPPREERQARSFEDPIEHLKEWFSGRIEAALDAGMDEEQIVIDPGLDFDLGVDDSLEVLRRLGELHALGRPLYVSLSRKDFLGAVLVGSWERRVPSEGREWATAAATALAVAAGAQILRLHDRSALQAVRVAGRIVDGH